MIASLSQFRQVRALGKGYAGVDHPAGRDTVSLKDGVVTFEARPGDSDDNVLRSQLAGWHLPRFGHWTLHAEFMVPTIWRQDACLIAFSAAPDEGEERSIRSAALALMLKGDELRLAKRFDANPITTRNPPAINLGTARLVPGKWHTLDLDMNHSWLKDGYTHASLDGLRIAADAGPNAYNDIRPPFPVVGVYSWAAQNGLGAGDPMKMHCRSFVVA